MTVTATVQGGSVAVVAPKPNPVIASPPTSTQSFVPRTSASGVAAAPAIQPVVPRASSPSNVTPPMPPTVAPVVAVEPAGHIEDAVIVPPTPPPPPAPTETNTSVPPASKPRTGVDLAEIDRYLEGLGKL